MIISDEAYRLFRDFARGISQLNDTKSFFQALEKCNDGTDHFAATKPQKEIDLDWVEAIERTLPYIDKAIREQRRFIDVSEEVVSIEKSRKITTESVRHLAQHTNIIGRVDEDGQVTPKKILNIQREESFLIYENRFLYTLIHNAILFVERVYNEVNDPQNFMVADMHIKRDTSVLRDTFSVALDCRMKVCSPESDKEDLLTQDVSEMTNLERVVRLRTILADFISTPLMRSLKGCEPVRSPITRTNVLTKNQNFREAVALWDFLASYTKTGYCVDSGEVIPDDLVGPNLKRGLYGALTYLNIALQLTLDAELRRKLEKRYIGENTRRRRKARTEQERLIDETVKELKEYYEKRLAKKKIGKRRRLAKQQAAYEKQLAEMKDDYEKQLAEMKESYEKQLAEVEAAYKNKIAEELANQNETHE